LKRIQKPKLKPVYKETISKPSPELLSLIGRMEARRWRDNELVCTLEYLKESAGEIDLIRHLRTCRECQLEAELSIERYYGRGLPWFLDLVNDVAESFEDPEVEADPWLKGLPRVQDYRIGSYWEDVEYARRGKPKPPSETLKFVEDRCDWAEKIIKQQIIIAAQFYKQLRNWDLNPPAPTEPTLPF